MSEGLDAVLGWIREDEKGVYSSTRFDNLSLAAAATAAADQCHAIHRERSRLSGHAHFLHQDWSNLLTILAKLSWMKSLQSSQQLPDETWMRFAASDIDMFHVEVRSALDHLAGCVSCLSERPRQVPDGSYHDLLKWCGKHQDRAADLLDVDLLGHVVGSEDWFRSLKDVRDTSVHQGGYNLVFPAEEKILFQVLSRKGNVIRQEAVMYNENVVDFSLYGALHLMSLWRLGEVVAQHAFRVLSLGQVGLGEGAMAYHPGLALVREWGRELLAVTGK